MRRILCLAALVTLATPSCCGKEKPAEYEYVLHFAKDSPLPSDAPLYLGEQKLGKSSRPSGSWPRIAFKLPAATPLHERADQLGVRFETPCGLSKPMGLDIENLRKVEMEWRETNASQIPLDAKLKDPSAVPSPARFWVDMANADAKVRVGRAEIVPTKDKPVDIWALGCAPQHDVTVDGKKVGTVSKDGVVEAVGATRELLDQERKAAARAHETAVDVAKYTKQPVPDAVFFIGREGACYRWELASYSAPGTGSGFRNPPALWQGRRLVQLPEDPSSFLVEAPDALKDSESQFLYELVPIDCTTNKTIVR